MEILEEQTLIKKIKRQGHREVIVWLHEFPFDWRFLKAEIQHVLNLQISDRFRVDPERLKIICKIRGE